MTSVVAIKIYSVLVDFATAPADESVLRAFVRYLIETPNHAEWRFGGSLGSGGKVYVGRDRWRVNCYPEDLTPERAEIIQKTNKALEELWWKTGGK